MKVTKLIAMLFILMSTASFVSACHTVKGAGKDIEKAGEEIQEASDDVREKN
jgi:predicted small secreted protein